MQEPKQILYFADGQFGPCAALSRAIELARKYRARLTLMDVTPESKLTADLIKRYGLADDAQQSEQRLAALNHLAEDWAGDLLPQLRSPIGNPFVEVIRAILRDNYDLVIKPARPRKGRVECQFGSVDMHLLRKCPCPVWIDRDADPCGDDVAINRRYRSILAAVDPTTPQARAMNAAIMERATALADREGAELNVVHAWQLPVAAGLSGSFNADAEGRLADALKQIERQHAEALGALVADYGLSLDGSRVHLRCGSPAEQVLAQADALNSDMIVMGTLGRSQESGVFIGTTAEELLQGARVSVLALKPQGFVSPVTAS